MKGLAVNLTAYGKPAPPPSHSPWKTLRVSHSFTASTTNIADLTLYRGTRIGMTPGHRTRSSQDCSLLDRRAVDSGPRDIRDPRAEHSFSCGQVSPRGRSRAHLVSRPFGHPPDRTGIRRVATPVVRAPGPHQRNRPITGWSLDRDRRR